MLFFYGAAKKKDCLGLCSYPALTFFWAIRWRRVLLLSLGKVKLAPKSTVLGKGYGLYIVVDRF